jgi:uncharacterized protein with NRDE domain
MCLILFSFNRQASDKHALVVAANRDEFFNRESLNANFWEDKPNILGGRDLVSQGTWLGITKEGRFAAVTNVREPHVSVQDALSRGQLTQGFLESSGDPRSYLEKLEPHKDLYSGFNLLVGEFTAKGSHLYYLSNRQAHIQELSSGVYGLSNGELNSNWPKVNRGRDWMESVLDQQMETKALHQQLRIFLEDNTCAVDSELPSTGIPLDKERALSSAFIELPNYGTRASTVLTIDHQLITFSEKNYDQTVDGQDAQPTFYTIDR